MQGDTLQGTTVREETSRRKTMLDDSILEAPAKIHPIPSNEPQLAPGRVMSERWSGIPKHFPQQAEMKSYASK